MYKNPDSKYYTVNGLLKYLPELRTISRRNRNNPTRAEKIFWDIYLKNDQTGFRFLRQKPIYKFIIDFYCPKLLLAIEIDGGSHQIKKYLDRERDKFLTNLGIKTIRFTNNQIYNNPTLCKENLSNQILEREIELKKSPPFIPPL